MSSIHELEHLIRRSVAQAVPAVGIDVVHHGVYVILREMVQGSAFRDEAPDELVVSFSGALLERGGGIAVEEPGTHGAIGRELDRLRVGELGAVVRKTDPEDGREQVMSQEFIKGREDPRHGSGGIGIPEEGEHQLSFGEMDGQEDLAALDAFNGIQLGHGDTGVVAEEGKKVLISAPDAAFGINLLMDEDPARLEADLPGEVDVHRRDGPGIDQPVDGALADGDDVGECRADMMR